MNTCPHCEEKFHNWVEYNEHLAFNHWKTRDISQSPFEEEVALESNVGHIKTYSSGRSDLQRKPWTGYMPRAQRDKIVATWENKNKGAIIQ